MHGRLKQADGDAFWTLEPLHLLALFVLFRAVRHSSGVPEQSAILRSRSLAQRVHLLAKRWDFCSEMRKVP